MKKNSLLVIIVSVSLAVILMGLGWIQVFRTEVTLTDGTQRLQIETFNRTVGAVLRSEKIVLGEWDQVSPPSETVVKDGMSIIITRFKPLIVKVNGVSHSVYGRNLTTREVIQKAGIELGSEDQVNIAADRIVRPGEIVEVTQVKRQVISEFKSMPFETVIRSSYDLLPGERRLAQRGTVGKVKRVYEAVYEGGKLIEKKLVRKEVMTAPVPQVILKGKNQPLLVASRGSAGGHNRPETFRTSYIMIATGYDLSFQSTGKAPGMRGYGITASGTKARVGTVAVDPRVIPLGTKLYIENMDGTGAYGYAVAEDTGGAIKGYRIDLFFNTTREALQFGRRQVKVYVLN